MRSWQSGASEVLLIALFTVWLWVALQGHMGMVVALAVAIVLIETI